MDTNAKFIATFFFAMAFAATALAGTNVYVSVTGTYVDDDKVSHPAWTDLQDAINASAKGDTVWVEDGYDWNPGENRFTDTTYGGRVLGVPLAMTVRSRSGNWQSGVTVHGRWNSATKPTGANALCGVCLAKGAKIIGFKIVDCASNTSLSYNYQAGAGLAGSMDCWAENCFIANCRASYFGASYRVELANCVVSNCAASTYGALTGNSGAKDCLFIDNKITSSGAYKTRYGHPFERCVFVCNSGSGILFDADGTGTLPSTVTDCVFSNNSVYCVGAASVKDRRLVAKNCLFTGNSASSFYAQYESGKYYNNVVTATDCIITNNAFSIYLATRAIELAGDYVNCLVADNSCRGQLIGVNDPDKNIRLLNCTVVNNTSSTDVSPAASVRVSAVNTILDGNVGKAGTTPSLGSATNCVFDFAASVEEDCQHVDPALVNPADGLYQPGDASPCLGRGSVTAYALPETDLAGNPRLTGDKVSVGAYEYDSTIKYVTASVTDYPKYLYAPADISFSASVCGLGTSGLTFHWDFDNDGTVDFVTDQTAFTHALGVGAYDPTLYISNATEGVTHRVGTTFAVSARPCRYVKRGNEGAAYPYMTEQTAAADIQTALDASTNGDEVVILKGVYNVSAPVCVTNELIVHGQSGNPEDVVIHQTASCRCLQICGGEQSVVHSLTVENGKASATFDYGAGVYMAQGTYAKAGDSYTPTAGSGLLSNVVVRNGSLNTKWSVCAGVYAKGPKCFVTHCVLTNNTSESAYCDGGIPHGVALHLVAGAKAENCLVAYNRSVDSLGRMETGNLWEGWSYGLDQSAVFVGDSSVLRYSTVVTNRMSFCGGVNVDDTGAFEKCIVAGNVVLCKNVRESSAGDRYRVWAAFSGAKRTTMFYHNKVEADYEQNVKDYLAAEVARAADADRQARQVTNAVDVAGTGLGAGTIVASSAQIFRNFSRDFRLRNDSPTVDVVPAAAETGMPSVDLNGSPRCINGAYDLGSFEKCKTPGLTILIR